MSDFHDKYHKYLELNPISKIIVKELQYHSQNFHNNQSLI